MKVIYRFHSEIMLMDLDSDSEMYEFYTSIGTLKPSQNLYDHVENISNPLGKDQAPNHANRRDKKTP